MIVLSLDKTGLAVVLLILVRTVLAEADVQDFVSLAGTLGSFLQPQDIHVGE